MCLHKFTQAGGMQLSSMRISIYLQVLKIFYCLSSKRYINQFLMYNNIIQYFGYSWQNGLNKLKRKN